MKFQEILNNLMNDRKISNYKMSKDTGISDSLIGYWRKGERKPTLDNLIVISKYLNVSIDYLIRAEYTSKMLCKNSNVIEVTKDNLLDSFYKLNKRHQSKVLTKIENYLEEYEDHSTDETTYSIKSIPLLRSDDDAFIKALSKQSVPILGLTAAGSPIEIIENNTDMLSVPDNVTIDFALKVKGDSMSPLIQSGDYIFIKHDQNIENGNIIVASIDNTATCKKYYKHKNRIELRSINPNYKPIIIKKGEFKIIGKVVLGQRDGNFYDIN